MDKFFGQVSTKEFIEAIIEKENSKSGNPEIGNIQGVIMCIDR